MAAGTQGDERARIHGAARPPVAAAVALIALAACGRFGFDPGDGDGDTDVDTDDDGDAGGGDIDAVSCLAGELRGPTGDCVPALVLDSSIVGYWPLDEADGTLGFRDLSGNGHDGSCVDACPIAGEPGIRGQAVDFTGTQQGIVVGVLTALNVPTPTMSIAAWVKLRVHDTYAYILSNDRDCCGEYSGFSLWASHYGLGPALQIWDGTIGPSVQPSEELSLGVWHQVVGTYDDSGVAAVYVDGQLVASNDRSLSMPPSFETTIGATSYNPGDYTLENGSIDEVLLLARALTADEILELYDYYVANAPP